MRSIFQTIFPTRSFPSLLALCTFSACPEVTSRTFTLHTRSGGPSEPAVMSKIEPIESPEAAIASGLVVTDETGGDDSCNILDLRDPLAFRKETPKVVKRDAHGKLAAESLKYTWQYFLKKRPIMNEQMGVPFGFETDDSGAVRCDEKDGRPIYSWNSYKRVEMEEFADLGAGIKLTFDFMWYTGLFFAGAWVLGLFGWILQLADPSNIDWISVTFATDVIFVWCFAGYMIYTRREMVRASHEIDRRNINSSDYAIQVDGLPPDTTEDEIATYFRSFGPLHYDSRPFRPNLYQSRFDQTGVYMVRNDDKLIRAAYSVVEANESILSADPGDSKSIASLTARRKKAVAEWTRRSELQYVCVGKAFVTFKYNQDQTQCLANWARNCKPFRPGQKQVNLHVVEAPEPTDILWRNLPISNGEVWVRQMVIGLASFFYLYLVSLVMVYCAAYSKANANDLGKTLLGTVGNILCCITSIVLLMPLASVQERVHHRSTLHVVTFLKLAWFQWAGTVFAALYVYGLGDKGLTMAALSNDQIAMWGWGLPTSECNTTRFTTSSTASMTLDPVDVASFGAIQCWAYTLHEFGTGIGGFLIGNLIGDVLLINMIDFVCPPWWGDTLGALGGAYFQTDLNRAFRGADFIPFLRYQILLKFLMVGMTVSCVDNPRIITLFVAVCFIQCFGIEKFNFLYRYKTPPKFGAFMYSVVVRFGLPVALLVHLIVVQILFGFTYGLNSDNSLRIVDNVVNGTDYGTISAIFFFIGVVFVIVWLLPFAFWNFPHLTPKHVDPPGIKAMVDALTFEQALAIGGDDDGCSSDHPLRKEKNFEIRKYLPNSTRRTFGVLKLN